MTVTASVEAPTDPQDSTEPCGIDKLISEFLFIYFLHQDEPRDSRSETRTSRLHSKPGQGLRILMERVQVQELLTSSLSLLITLNVKGQ